MKIAESAMSLLGRQSEEATDQASAVSKTASGTDAAISTFAPFASGFLNEARTAPFWPSPSASKQKRWADVDLDAEQARGHKRTRQALDGRQSAGQKRHSEQLRLAEERAASGRAIGALAGNSAVLQQKGFTADALATLAVIGGEKAIVDAAKDFFALQALGLSAEDTLKVVKGGGAQAISAVLAHAEALEAFGLDGKDMVKVAGNTGSAQAVAAIVSSSVALPALHVFAAQLVWLGCKTGCSRSIQFAVEFSSFFHPNKLTAQSFWEFSNQKEMTTKRLLQILQEMSILDPANKEEYR